MELNPKDLIVETFRVDSKGGFGFIVETGVRITHKPTGISVSKSDDRSVHMNKADAMADLTAAVAKYCEPTLAAMSIAQPQVKLYGCHDRPRPMLGGVTHYGQNGYGPSFEYSNGGIGRNPLYVEIRHVFTTECMYDLQTTDKRCANCKHIKG